MCFCSVAHRTTLRPRDQEDEGARIRREGDALAIGIIACQQGFAASAGAEGVGHRTTKTVVTCLFALVVIDAVFTVLFRILGL